MGFLSNRLCRVFQGFKIAVLSEVVSTIIEGTASVKEPGYVLSSCPTTLYTQMRIYSQPPGLVYS